MFGEMPVGFAEAFVAAGVGVAEDAGEEADGGVEEDGGGEFAAGEDVVADGEFFVAEELADALVDAFVTATDEDQAVEGGETAGGGLREALALRGEQDDRLLGWRAGGARGAAGGFCGEGQGLEAVEDGLGFEDHALAAAEGTVVDGAVTVVGKGAEVVDVGAGQAGAERARDHAVAQDALVGEGAEEVGKDGEDVEAHRDRD